MEKMICKYNLTQVCHRLNLKQHCVVSRPEDASEQNVCFHGGFVSENMHDYQSQDDEVWH